MTFVSSFRHIRKAAPRKKWKATRTYHRLESLSHTMANSVQVDLTKGITKFKSKIKTGEVYDAWLSRNWGRVIEVMPWDSMTNDIEPAFDGVGEILSTAAGITIESLPTPKDTSLRFDTSNPSIRGFIEQRGAHVFTNLTQDSALNIQSMVTRSMNNALTPRQVANQVRDSIGLLPIHYGAVERLRSSLRANPETAGQADLLAGQYADRLIDYRAMMISRTETRLATNRGQLAVWQQAADRDLIDRDTARKVWIVDGDPCEVCEPMDGVAVPLDSSWQLNNGDSVDVPTESHPHCYCGMELEFTEPEDKLDESDSGDETDEQDDNNEETEE